MRLRDWAFAVLKTFTMSKKNSVKQWTNWFDGKLHCRCVPGSERSGVSMHWLAFDPSNINLVQEHICEWQFPSSSVFIISVTAYRCRKKRNAIGSSHFEAWLSACWVSLWFRVKYDTPIKMKCILGSDNQESNRANVDTNNNFTGEKKNKRMPEKGNLTSHFL